MSWLHAVRERIIDQFHDRKRQRELAEEVQYHLELETQRQESRGLGPDAARAAAIARFGNVNRVSDATRDERGTHPFRGVTKDLAWSFRSLVRHPAFAVLSVLTVALGIGASTVSFAVLDTLLLRTLPFREADRLVMIEERTVTGDTRAPSYPNFDDWRGAGELFDGVASQMYTHTATVVVDDRPMRATLTGLSRNFFAIVGAPPALGREFTLEENSPGGPDAVMVSHEFWKSTLGGRQVLGTIRLANETVPIVGVAAPGFRLVTASDVYFAHERGPGTIRSAHNYIVVGRLATGVTIERARSGMQVLSRNLKQMHGSDTEAVDVAMTPLHDYLVRNYRVLTMVVFGASAMVLLIACTNMLSAQLARGLGRGREVAVRVALGASRGRLIRQLFIESTVVAIAGASVGTAISSGLAYVVRTLGSAVVPRLGNLNIDARVLVFCIAATVVTSLLIGLYPAFRLTASKRGRELRSGHGNTSAAARAPVWSMLIGFEIATAVMLLVGCTLLVRTVQNILSSDVGFDARGVVTASFDPGNATPAEIERILGELSAIPGAEVAAIGTQLPLAWGSNSAPVVRPTDSPGVWPARAGFRVVSPDYFRVLRQPILQGRAFSATDASGALPVAIITPGIAHALWPDENPIGKLVRTNYLSTQWLTVVGVVGEASNWAMPRGAQNEIFTPFAQQSAQARNSLVAMIRTTNNAAAFVTPLRQRLQLVAPGIAATFSTIEARISTSAADRRLAMTALSAFAAVALILAGIGIYGVMSYAVSARTREFGVRIALGAVPAAIQRQVLQSALNVAMGGVTVGLLASLFASRYLKSVLYGVSAIDPLAYASGVVMLLGAALLGAYLPARRSSRINPLDAIRGE